MRWLLIVAIAGCGCGEDKCPMWTQAISGDQCHVPGGEAGAKASAILPSFEEGGREAPLPREPRDEDAGEPEAGHVAEAGKGGAGSAGEAGKPAAAGSPAAGTGGMEAAGAPSYSPDAGVDAGPVDVCGDGKVTADELCDGDCPTSCEQDSDPCTINELIGTGCSITCRKLTLARESITCDDGNECTDDSSFESASQCAYACRFIGKTAGAACNGGNGVCSGALRNTCQTLACSDDSGCPEDRWCSTAGRCEVRRAGLCTRDRNCLTGQMCKSGGNGFSECG